ncbi:MAG: type I-D CRISPR-associated helicase Cas3' [Spirulina sp. SIO3F2]|nr:type I-D CRISPR-associated helicase Cas3' [Spirulina sp. SIO3F2]
MANYSITLKPVYSCPADETPEGVKLPEGWQLAWHQAETYKALQNPDIDVVFNTAMTGDGKSLAAYLSVLQGQDYAIGLYPTNALARDQEMQIQHYIEMFPPQPKPPRVNRLSGPELEIYAEQESLKKGSAIASRSSQSEVLVTNPDIFHYLHRGKYLLPGKENPDKLWNRIDKDFDVFIFDEFHVFSAPQIAGVLNTMLLIRATNRCKKFLFLSATPNDSLLARFEAAGFRTHVVNPIAAKMYQFPDDAAAVTQLTQRHWRPVARAIDLEFISLEPTGQASETWLKEHQAQILAYFQSHPHSRGAIILNSIAAVKRLTPIFKELFAPYGLTVRENTGLSGSTEKATSLDADLVIGTSTIDVGVDFKINFLIFESADAGNFIQRLGRLGRHDEAQKDKPFQGFKAYALVPNFFVGRLFEMKDAPLATGQVCDRISFHDLIHDNYRSINSFEDYYRKWGMVQSADILLSLKRKELKSQYKDSCEQFGADCQQVFRQSFGKVFYNINEWKQEWGKEKKGNPIAENAKSFRGSSPLLCGLYDLTEKYAGDRFKTYELPGILSNLNIEMWTKKAFLDELDATAQRLGEPIAKGRFRHCLGFMKLQGYREERLNWTFTYPDDLQPVADAWRVQVLRGVQVWQPDNVWIGSINRQLRTQALVCFVVRKPMREVRAKLQLPMHFQIYPISDAGSVHDASAPYAIAFGQSALLLETLAYRVKGEGGELWIA